MGDLETCLSGGLGSAGLRDGISDPKGPSQPKHSILISKLFHRTSKFTTPVCRHVANAPETCCDPQVTLNI